MKKDKDQLKYIAGTRVSQVIEDEIRRRTNKGTRRSEVIREAIAQGLGVEPQRIEIEGLDGLITELKDLGPSLGRVGGNLNQLAHYYHIHDQIEDDDMAVVHRDLQIVFNELMQLFRELRDGIHRDNR